MTQRDVPAEWADLLTRARLVGKRGPSMSRLSEASGVHTSTISAMMHGSRVTSSDVIDKVAEAIAGGIGPRADHGAVRHIVHELVGRALAEREPFQPHPDADLLDSRERKAVNELIRLLALPKKRGGGAHGDSAAPTNDPGSGPADLLVRRYLKQADGDPAVAAQLLAHDGAKGANVDEDSWNAALEELADAVPDSQVRNLPDEVAARRNKEWPRRGQMEQGAD